MGWNSIMDKIWFIDGCALSTHQTHFHVWIWIFEHPSVNAVRRWNECNENGWDEDWWMKPAKPNKTTWILMCEYKRIFHGWTKRLMNLCDIVKWNEDWWLNIVECMGWQLMDEYESWTQELPSFHSDLMCNKGLIVSKLQLKYECEYVNCWKPLCPTWSLKHNIIYVILQSY